MGVGTVALVIVIIGFIIAFRPIFLEFLKRFTR